jgi:hypothetical protein
MWMRCDICHDETHGTRDFLTSIGWVEEGWAFSRFTCPHCAELARSSIRVETPRNLEPAAPSRPVNLMEALRRSLDVLHEREAAAKRRDVP